MHSDTVRDTGDIPMGPMSFQNNTWVVVVPPIDWEVFKDRKAAFGHMLNLHFKLPWTEAKAVERKGTVVYACPNADFYVDLTFLFGKRFSDRVQFFAV